MDEKVIIVTGGSGGIGNATIKRLSGSNTFVINIDKIVVSNCDAFYEVDVTKPDEVQEAVEEITRNFGKVDHIVSLAGRALPGEWGGLNDTDINTIIGSISQNLTSHLVVTKAFLPLMKHEGDKSVTFVSSINALKDFGLPGYSAAKAGLLGLVPVLAADLGRSLGIRVNAILPGTTPTPATLKEPKDFPKLLEGTAIARFATPEDIAEWVTFLALTAKSTTGGIYVCDAGQTAVTTYSAQPANWPEICREKWKNR